MEETENELTRKGKQGKNVISLFKLNKVPFSFVVYITEAYGCTGGIA